MAYRREDRSVIVSGKPGESEIDGGEGRGEKKRGGIELEQRGQRGRREMRHCQHVPRT